MPLYEYKCNKCGHRFEKIEKVDAPEIAKCPKCGAKAPRMASAPAIQFKGTGWYVSDYGGKTGQPPSGETSGSKSESKSEGASDSKSSDSKTSDTGSTPASGSKESSSVERIVGEGIVLLQGFEGIPEKGEVINPAGGRAADRPPRGECWQPQISGLDRLHHHVAQIFPKVAAQRRILQRQLDCSDQKSQLVAGVVGMSLMDRGPQPRIEGHLS